jgi:hypothetical protein
MYLARCPTRLDGQAKVAITELGCNADLATRPGSKGNLGVFGLRVIERPPTIWLVRVAETTAHAVNALRTCQHVRPVNDTP